MTKWQDDRVLHQLVVLLLCYLLDFMLQETNFGLGCSIDFNKALVLLFILVATCIQKSIHDPLYSLSLSLFHIHGYMYGQKSNASKCVPLIDARIRRSWSKLDQTRNGKENRTKTEDWRLKTKEHQVQNEQWFCDSDKELKMELVLFLHTHSPTRASKVCSRSIAVLSENCIASSSSGQ